MNDLNAKMKFTISFFLMFFCVLGAFAQEKTISGVVKDIHDEPVIGANVIVKGTTIGTVTDIEGKFMLKVPQSAQTLQISYLGMKNVEVPITDEPLNVVMEEDISSLDEVVVIGYGTTKKRDLTGAVSSVSGDQIAKIPVTNTAQAMAGRLAGVQITTADGSPDAQMIVRVRGGGSITGDNTPLYIVDGFPVNNINDIAPADIESIDVLKDASSTAIYGARGANGVVLITTKSARAGKTLVSYNGYFQGKELSKRLDVLDPYEYVMYNYEKAVLGGEDDIKNFERTFGVYEDLDLYKYQKGIDWQEDMFGNTVLSQQHNLSITGGTEKTKFSLSGTYNKDGGLMKNNDYNRTNLNFKLNHEIIKGLTFDFNSRISDTEINGSGTSGGTYKIRTIQALTSPAVRGLTDFIEVDLNTLPEDEREQYIRSHLTLSEQADQYWRRQNKRRFYFGGGISWDIIKPLRFRSEFNYDYGFNEDKHYWGQYTSNASYVGGLPLADWTKENTNSYRWANTLSYSNSFGNHRFDAMMGQEMYVSGNNNNYMYATGYSIDLSPEKIFANMGLAGGTLQSTSYISPDSKLASFFGRLNYSYAEKYLFTFTFRADGSSKFPKNNRWGYFPAFALGWRISEEEFMKNQDVISNLKLRSSYGEAGNDRIKSTLYKLDYKIQNSKTYGIGDKPNPYYEATNKQLANPNLRWETMVTRNVGLDFGLFNERLSGSIDAYWNTTKDLLLDAPIVAPGYTTQLKNAGQTSNKGVELVLNAYLLQHKDYFLSTNFNIGFNRSNVDKLIDDITFQEYASGWAGTDLKGYYDYLVKIGEPVGLIQGFVTDGYYTTDDFEIYDEATNKYVLNEGVPSTGFVTIRPGSLKLKDLTGDGFVDENDRTIIGKASPKFSGGFGFNGAYKNFDATILFNYVYGNDIYNANKIASSQTYRTTYSNLLGFMNSANRYTYLDDQGQLVTDLETLAAMNEGAYPKKYWSPHCIGNAVVFPHSWAIEDGSFLRLQNITVGYTLPRDLTRKFACNQLRLYCTLNNVWIWTNYSGYDPEVSSPVRSSSVSGLTPGVDYSSYPKSFSYTLGVNINF